MRKTPKQKAATKKPPKKKVQKVKGKKSEDSRNAVPICGASDHRIWCIFDAADERWVRSTSSATGDQKKLVDSRVHRYGCEVGYSNGEDDSHFDSHLKAVEERLRNMTYLKKSGKWPITNQGNFECYVLNAHVTDPYSKFLLEIENPQPGAPRKDIAQPSQRFMQSCICHMSDEGDKMNVGVEGRTNAFNSVRGRLGAVSGTLREFGIPTGLEKDATTSKLVDHLKESNDPRRAPAFNPDEALPKLFCASFVQNTFPRWTKKAKVWTRLLVMLALIARSSDVTDCCPKFETLKFPDDPMDFTPDGLPRCVQVCFTDWKGRPEWLKTQQSMCRIRLCANTKDLRHCPVHWLFKHWSIRKENGDPLESGPILDHVSSANNMLDLKELFLAAGLADCSSHSIRRSASQWARRCGADIVVIRNIGRWVAYSNLFLYIAEAEKISRDKRRRNNGRDPAWDFWMFDTDSQCDTMDKVREYTTIAVDRLAYRC
jgi:hypothetical protein